MSVSCVGGRGVEAEVCLVLGVCLGRRGGRVASQPAACARPAEALKHVRKRDVQHTG